MLAFALAFQALLLVTFELVEAGTPALFPAAGLALAAFALLPKRLWPLLAGVVFACEVTLDLRHDLPLGFAMAAAAANTLEPLVGALLLRRLNGHRPTLDSIDEVRGFVVALAVGCGIGGSIGGAALVQAGLAESWPTVARDWFVADAVGALAVAPAVLVASRARTLLASSRDKRASLLGICVAVTGAVAIALVARQAVVYVLAVLAVWAALRFKVEGAALAGLIVSAVVAADGALDLRLFGELTTRGIELQEFFLAILLVGSLLVGAESRERGRLFAQLRRQRKSLQAVIDHSPLAIVEVSTTDWTVSRWNPAAERMFGFAAHEVVGRPASLFSGDAGNDLRAMILTPGADLEVEAEADRQDGTRIPVLLSGSRLYGENGHPERVVMLLQDVTERKELERQLMSETRHDTLTGLANRASLLERLAHELRRQARHGGVIGVVDIDIDRFAAINHVIGHAHGDALLVEVARRLQRVVRATDTFARVAADEFMIVADEIGDARGAVDIAQRVTAELAEPIDVAGRLIPVSVSMGIVIAEGGRSTPDTLLGHANAALVLARSRGPGRYELHDPAVRTSTAVRLDDEAALSRALDGDEMRLVFQPKFDLNSGRIAGVEALVRWERDGMTVLPASFIPLAEETGLIVPVGYWVLEQACRKLAAWRVTLGPMAPLTTAVNVSARQLVEPGFVEAVEKILRRTGIEPELVELEVTESVAIEDHGAGVATLHDLKRIGVSLAIDDFGTGYSSLSQLHTLPIDVLKIDRSFLSGLGSSPRDSAIVGAVITLAQSLGLQVVAEGVETPEQLTELVRLGCDLAQGFLLSHPVADRELRERVWDGDVVRRHLTPSGVEAAAA